MYISHLLALFLRLIPDTPYLPRILKGPFSAIVLVSGFSIKISSYLSLLPGVSQQIFTEHLCVSDTLLCSVNTAKQKAKSLAFCLPIQEIDNEQIKLL